MSEEKYYLRYKNTIIGCFQKSNNNLHYSVLKCGADSIPSDMGYPIGMFPIVRKGNRVMPDRNHTPKHNDIMHWLSDRVFPENRQGSYFLLNKLGLTHYDPWEIAKSTNASVLTDNYWMSDDPADRYEAKHIRYKIRGVLPSDFVKKVMNKKAALDDIEKSFDELSVSVESLKV